MNTPNFMSWNSALFFKFSAAGTYFCCAWELPAIAIASNDKIISCFIVNRIYLIIFQVGYSLLNALFVG